jgi:hypothetical protein
VARDAWEGETMQAQIVENWSDIVGELKEYYPSKDNERFVTLKSHVKDVKPVKGFRNLLEEAVGKTIEVNIPRDVANTLDLAAGLKVSCRVRRAGVKKIFVHPEIISTKK